MFMAYWTRYLQMSTKPSHFTVVKKLYCVHIIFFIIIKWYLDCSNFCNCRKQELKWCVCANSELKVSLFPASSAETMTSIISCYCRMETTEVGPVTCLMNNINFEFCSKTNTKSLTKQQQR